MLVVMIELFFAAMSSGINHAFAQRTLQLWRIDGGYRVVRLALYGLVLGAWR